MVAHGALEADFPPGALVEFCPAQTLPGHPRNERGLVVRANDAYVFVRFEKGPSKAVSPLLLVLIADPIPDPRIRMIEDVLAQWRAEGDTAYRGADMLMASIEDALVGAVDQSSEPES